MPSEQEEPAVAEASAAMLSAHERTEIFTEVFLHSGWSRWLPEGAVVVLGVLIESPLTRDELQSQLRTATSNSRGLDSSAWDPLHQWIDEELFAQRAEFADTPFASTDQDPSTAAEVMAEEAERRRRRLGEVDRHAAFLGQAPVRTLGELVELMVACRVLVVDAAGRYDLNSAAPLPGEVLPLEVDESSREDRLRWSDLHEPTAQAIIRLFKPIDAQPLTHLQTSLRQLAEQVEADVESVRAGLTNLLNDGDFSLNRDLPTAGENEPLALTVDWERFNRTRFSIRRGTSPSDTAPAPDPEDDP